MESARYTKIHAYCPLLVGERLSLEGEELGIAAVERHQFRVRAMLGDSAIFDDCYLIRAPHCRESVGDVHCRPEERGARVMRHEWRW